MPHSDCFELLLLVEIETMYYYDGSWLVGSLAAHAKEPPT